jgi:cell division transport system permease protein
MYTIFRVLSFALQSIARNIWLSIATVTILILSLLSINLIVGFNFITDTALEAVEEKIDVSVYFAPEVSSQDILDFRGYLLESNLASSIDYVSPEDALEEFRARHQDEIDILESLDELDENPLSGSLLIRADSIERYEQLIVELGKSDYEGFINNTAFDDYRSIVSTVNDIAARVKMFAYILSVVFLIISALIIFNTVRVGLYTHREEIAIMKLVGATNTFIRVPFLVEMVLLGIFALGLTIMMIFPVLNLLQPILSSFFGIQVNMVGYFVAHAIPIFGVQAIAISLLNVISSYFAIGKYMKV